MDKIIKLEMQLWCFGALALIGGSIALISKRRQLRDWVKAEATVHNIHYDKEGLLKLTVKFQDNMNRPHRVVIGATDGQSLGLGSMVNVAYDPANPDKATVADKWQVGLGIGGSIALGLLFLGLATVVTFRL